MIDSKVLSISSFSPFFKNWSIPRLEGEKNEKWIGKRKQLSTNRSETLLDDTSNIFKRLLIIIKKRYNLSYLVTLTRNSLSRGELEAKTRKSCNLLGTIRAVSKSYRDEVVVYRVSVSSSSSRSLLALSPTTLMSHDEVLSRAFLRAAAPRVSSKAAADNNWQPNRSAKPAVLAAKTRVPFLSRRDRFQLLSTKV